MPTAASMHAMVQLPKDTTTVPEVAEGPGLEAARYAVLRRIGPALRHQIAGALQPMNMMASMLERRVQMDVPDTATLRKNSAEMTVLCRSAGNESIALMAWVTPTEGAQIELGAGVDACVDLLSTEFSFRGFAIVTVTSQCAVQVSQTAVRAVLPAALIALSDAADQPSRFEVAAITSNGTAKVSVAMRPMTGDGPVTKAKAYRPLAWSEVELLAAAERVTLTMDEQAVHLTFAPHEPELLAGADVRWG